MKKIKDFTHIHSEGGISLTKEKKMKFINR